MGINGVPATSEQLKNAYIKTLYEAITDAHLKAITDAHLKAIRFGDLEEITTRFQKS